MNALRKKINQNIWLKISSFNALAVFSRVVGSWLVNKLIAIYIGPSGTSLTEQYRNFLQTTQGMASLGLSDGVTKYAAKYENHTKRFSSFLWSIYKLIITSSFFMGIIIWIEANQISHFLFKTSGYTNLIRLTAIMLPLMAFNIIFTAILSGLQQYKKITAIQIVSQIATALMAVYLIINFHLKGALWLILAGQFIHFAVSLWIIRKKYRYFLNFLPQKTDKNNYKRLYRYMLMAVVTAITAPVFSILIRNQIFNFYAFDHGVHAGYWDGVKKISAMAMAFITPVFSFYYYPQLVKVHDNITWREEIRKYFKQIFPLIVAGLVLLYLLRKWLILLFFSKAYLPMEALLPWQFAGDLIRISALTLAYMMLAKAHTFYYIFTEIGFWVIFYLLSHFLLIHYGITGIVKAYFLTYIVYIFILIILYRKLLFTKEKRIIK